MSVSWGFLTDSGTLSTPIWNLQIQVWASVSGYERLENMQNIDWAWHIKGMTAVYRILEFFFPQTVVEGF